MSTQEIDLAAGTDSHPNDPHVATPGRCVRSRCRRPRERSARSPTSTVRTPRPGLPAELLGKRQQQALLVATFAQQENQIARAVWAGVAPVHRRVVRYLLERASRRIREKERDG